jgi:hypothetical protein
MLKDESTIPNFSSDPFAIEVFKQRDGVFPSASNQLFEAPDVYGSAAPIQQLLAQGLQGIAMDVHLMVAHFDEYAVAEEQCHVPAQVGFGQIEAGANFAGQRRRQPRQPERVRYGR